MHSTSQRSKVERLRTISLSPTCLGTGFLHITSIRKNEENRIQKVALSYVKYFELFRQTLTVGSIHCEFEDEWQNVRKSHTILLSRSTCTVQK